MNLKETIARTAREFGFQRAVIAGLAPMEAACQEYEQWLDLGYAGTMDYLKRDPKSRTSPAKVYAGATSAIVVSASYYTEVPPDPGPSFGRVARYAVGKDYHVVLRARLRDLKAALEERLGRPILAKPYTDDVALFEQAFASTYGLGFAGKNTLIIGPKMAGSYNFIAELFTDLELEPDEAYQGTCGACFRCATGCPTDAIKEPYLLDARLCISYLTIENKDGIPLELRERLGHWVFGCDVCQEVCPYNQRPPQTEIAEFHPEHGTGHYIDLFDLLHIKNQDEFHRRFLPTPVRRPKRRGLLRNALVVLGNRQPEGGAQEIFDFACREEDPMLREHAGWALSRYADGNARQMLEQLLAREPDADARRQMRQHLERGQQ